MKNERALREKLNEASTAQLAVLERDLTALQLPVKSEQIDKISEAVLM